MAESVVTFFLDKLSELIIREANLLAGVDEQIGSLSHELELINSILRDRNMRLKENERTRVWVDQVRDVAYDAEDVIDEFVLKVERQRRRNAGVAGFLRRYICCINQFKILRDVGNEIEIINRRAEKVFENKSKYGIEMGASSSSFNQDFSWQPRSTTVVEEADVVGFEEQAKTIVSQLTDGETKLRVISILGMGGQGKTTLAKKVYKSIEVSRHFECCAWIYISQEYKCKELLMGIMKQVSLLTKEEEKKLENMDVDGVGKELLMYLKERKYLVVVDDIWSVEAWDSLESIFLESAKGSRVMLTTRNKEVALHAKSIPNELRFLGPEECWTLFCKKALFNNVTNVFSVEMEKIGREIVAKCGGLPLAVVVLGGFLSRKDQMPSEWEKVLKRINWQLDEPQNQISTILSLSYNDLPYFLKPCFLYFSVFPEDFEIPTRKLIQLWVAEGLVQQRGDGTMEEVAEDYLEELIGRSMVQVSKRRTSGGIKTCRIHDLLRDLSISEAKGDKFLDVHRSAEFSYSARARRLTIHGSINEYISRNHPTSQLRSLLQLGPHKYGEKLGKENCRTLCSSFRLLRVLDLPGVKFLKLPSEIGEMIHLRYLGLRGSDIRRVPSTISKLVHLQTLDIRCGYLSASYHQVLPSGINKMDQLRHLCMKWGKISRGFRIDCLRNLQTLSNIEAGTWIEKGLVGLTNLRKLGVHGVLNSHKDTLNDAIAKLNGLQSLRLGSIEDKALPTLKLSNHMHLYKLHLRGCLEKLPEFPPNLTHVYLLRSDLTHDPMATLEKMPHLKILKLTFRTFKGNEMLCTAEGFPHLKELQIDGFPNLGKWNIEEGAMPTLGRLKISRCPALKTLPEGLQHVTTLKELELDDMSEALKTRILADNGEDRNKVQHVPSLIMGGRKWLI